MGKPTAEDNLDAYNVGNLSLSLTLSLSLSSEKSTYLSRWLLKEVRICLFVLNTS